MIDEKDMRIDKGDYWEMIKELSGALWLGAMFYGLTWLGFCL